jgi:hypothetical protein
MHRSTIGSTRPRALFGAALVLLCLAYASAAAAQQQPVPRPFPTPGQQRPGAPPADPAQPAQPAPRAPAAPAQAADVPSEATLGVAVYPGSQFLASYDAGQGQRYYLFGTPTPYEQCVLYYRNILRQRGDVVFEEPPTHIFEIGRFREESMAFPPSVVVKDYTWGGYGGYLNPVRGGDPPRFPTVIQIVPPSPASR